MNTRSIKGLNTLRLTAFLLVFIFHTIPAFQFGQNGVSFFYVISSFLLTHLALTEIHSTNQFSRKNFFIRRALRIYPLYYLVIVFAFIVLPILSKTFHFPATLPEAKWKYLFFLSNYDYSDHVFFLKLLWSIAVEEQFYIAFILLSIFFRNYLLPLCAIMFSLYLAYEGFVTKGFIENTYYNPLTYLPCFISGMVLAKIHFSYPSMLKKILLIAFALSIIIYAGSFFSTYLKNAINISVACLFSILLGIVLLQKDRLDKYNNRVFEMLEFFGKITYGLYVYSGLVITLNLTVLHIHAPLLKIIALSLLLFPIAYISYRYYELFFLRLKDKFR